MSNQWSMSNKVIVNFFLKMAFYQIGIMNFGFHVHMKIFLKLTRVNTMLRKHTIYQKNACFVYKMKKCHKKQWGSNNPVSQKSAVNFVIYICTFLILKVTQNILIPHQLFFRWLQKLSNLEKCCSFNVQEKRTSEPKQTQ